MKYLLSLFLLGLLACGGKGSNTPSADTSGSPTPASDTMGVFRTLKADVSGDQVESLDTRSGSTSIVMSTKRVWHRSLLLKNGKVLILGGDNAPVSTADIFDPDIERFIPSKANFKLQYSKAAGFPNFGMVNLPNGQVYVAGGYSIETLSSGFVAVHGSTSIFNYDPDLDTATEITNAFPEPLAGVEHMVYLQGMKILLMGLRKPDCDNFAFYDYALVYDANHNTSEIISCPYKYTQSAYCEDNKGIYFLGGANFTSDQNNRASHSVVVKFNRTHYTFEKIGDLKISKFGFGIVKLAKNQVGIYGGYTWEGVEHPQWMDPKRLKDVETFDLGTCKSTSKAPLLSAVSQISSVPLQGSDYTLHAGGVDDVGFTAHNEYVHNATTNVSGSTGTLVEPRRGHDVTNLPNGLVLISGGQYGADLTPTVDKNTAEIYDPKSKLFVTFTTDQIPTGSSLTFKCSQSVNWSVFPEDSLETDFGSITSGGVYTASSTNLNTLIVRVKATLKSNSAITAEVRIKILGIL